MEFCRTPSNRQERRHKHKYSYTLRTVYIQCISKVIWLFWIGSQTICEELFSHSDVSNQKIASKKLKKDILRRKLSRQ